MGHGPVGPALARHVGPGAVSRANASRRRQKEWHTAVLKSAKTPSEELSAACDWLRAEARRGGPDVIKASAAAVLGLVEQLRTADEATASKGGTP